MSNEAIIAATTIPEIRQGATVDLSIRISRFNLPPVQSALVVGKLAVIGSRAIGKALEEMMPNTFERHEVDHPLIEAILIRSAHLRRVPADRLIPVLIRHAEGMMSDQDMLHFDISLQVHITERMEL